MIRFTHHQGREQRAEGRVRSSILLGSELWALSYNNSGGVF
jgi:hypothetical protein